MVNNIMKVSDRTLPCEFDHMYTSYNGPRDPTKSISDKACSDYAEVIDRKSHVKDKNGKRALTRSFDRNICEKHVDELEHLLYFHLEVIKQQSLELDEVTQQIADLKHENMLLKKKVNFMQEMRDSFQSTLAQESDNKPLPNSIQKEFPQIKRSSPCRTSAFNESFRTNKIFETSLDVTHAQVEFDDNTVDPLHIPEHASQVSFEVIETDIASHFSTLTRKRRDKPETIIPFKTRAVSLSPEQTDWFCENNDSAANDTNIVHIVNKSTPVSNKDSTELSVIQGQPSQVSSDTTSNITCSKKPNHLTTKLPYKILISEIIRPPEPDKPKQEEGIEIPSWRIKHFGNLYSMDGTESLDDSSFLKRHQKNETDEKRRKRWDIQRLREQKRYERLKQRYYKTEKEKSPSEEDVPCSFYPDPFKIKYLHMCEELPVTAFGNLVPSLAKTEFSLPWKTSTDLPPTCPVMTKSFRSRKPRQDQKKNT